MKNDYRMKIKYFLFEGIKIRKTNNIFFINKIQKKEHRVFHKKKLFTNTSLIKNLLNKHF